MSFKILGAGLIGLVASFNASAILVNSFNGSYDETTGIESSGDYDNIGGLTDIGDFALVEGLNSFKGSIFTPTDSADVFNIIVAANQTLVGASLVFAENVTPFNPFFGFPSPTWGLYESTVTPTIFEFKVPDSNGSTVAFTSSQTFTRGEGIYNMLFGNGTFGMNAGGGVDYTITFTVTQTAPPPPPPPISQVSAPSIIALFSAMMMLIVGFKRFKS